MSPLLPHLDSPAGYQMALDEACLLGLAGELTLRTYTFAPSAWSLGFFQTLADVPAVLAAHQAGYPVVRRATGGGAIHHQHELTFSLSAPATHPLFAGPISASYERIHQAVAAAIHAALLEALSHPALGPTAIAPPLLPLLLAEGSSPRASSSTAHNASLGQDSPHPSPSSSGAPPPFPLRRNTPLASDQPGTGLCFHASSPLDLIAPGPTTAPAKLVGSAQRRTHGRILHHGSIKLAEADQEPAVATLIQAPHLPTFLPLLAEHLQRALLAPLTLARSETTSTQPQPPTQTDLPPAALRWTLARADLFSSPALLARTPEALQALRAPPSSIS